MLSYGKAETVSFVVFETRQALRGDRRAGKISKLFRDAQKMSKQVSGPAIGNRHNGFHKVFNSKSTRGVEC